jgi:hypothetical protein
MSGIVFLKCVNLETVKNFYMETVGMKVWLEQPDICILRHGNMLVGFDRAGSVDSGCLLTFFYETRGEVAAMFEIFGVRAETRPRVNEKYRIYNFFAKDPEGRNIEFQAFLHPVETI